MIPSAKVAPDNPPSGLQPAGSLWRAAALLVGVLLLAPQPVVVPLAAAIRAAQEAQVSQDYEGAADALTDAAARVPYSGDLVYRAGLADISAGRFEAAVRHIFAAAAIDGWTPARRIALGDAYLGLGEHDAALAQWEQAQVDLPEDAALLARLANSYEKVGRYADAVAVLNTLGQVRGANPAVAYRLALLTAATAPDRAIAALLTAAELAPEVAPNLQVIIQAIEAGQSVGDPAYTFASVGFALEQITEWGLAELALTQAVTLNPEYADAYAYLGLAQDMQAKDGFEAYARAVELAPESPLAQYLLGLHWRRLGDSNQALPHLQAAQALDPQNPALAAELGGAYASQGDLVNAEIWFAEAVKLDEKNPEFWLLLARFYLDHDYHVAELGLPAARMAAGLAPNSAAAADVLGFALVLTGDLVNGQKMLEQALALDPQQASTYYHLGILFVKQGKTIEAEAALNQALALDPDGPIGGAALRALASLTP